MQYHKLLLDEKGKLLTLMDKCYIQMNFSKFVSIIENNLAVPCWMDTYITIFQTGIEPDITAYDILLKKLSIPIVRFHFVEGDKDYIASATPAVLDLYLWYFITGEATDFYIETQFVPQRDYMKEIFKFSRFHEAGIYLKNTEENTFVISPTEYEFHNLEEAMVHYNHFLDAYDVYRSLKLSSRNFIANLSMAMKFGKDKRLLATISNILSYFDLPFEMKDVYITLKGSEYQITNEKEADRFQAKLMDAYQFFRNVINAENKKDIVSEVFNRKIAPEIRKQFEENVNDYLKVIKNQELVDWIITISKESKYTLSIRFDDQGVFYVDNNIITSALEAKEFYIDYMDHKKEKLAMTIYKNNIVNRIKSIWNKFRARFAKI